VPCHQGAGGGGHGEFGLEARLPGQHRGLRVEAECAEGEAVQRRDVQAPVHVVAAALQVVVCDLRGEHAVTDEEADPAHAAVEGDERVVQVEQRHGRASVHSVPKGVPPGGRQGR